MEKTKKKAPGKSHRKGISLKALLRRFSTDKKAERWFVRQRWPNGVWCPHCGSFNVQVGCKHKTMPFRCREKACGRKRFSVRTGTVMECSKVGYQDWVIAMFLVMTSLKGVSSMKLHRDLDVTQKTAWFLSMRIRFALSQSGETFAGPVEVDETYVGGKRRNMSTAKRRTLVGRGPVGKAAVVGAKDRETNRVAAKAVTRIDKDTLQRFVKDHVAEGATVYTDEAAAYKGVPYRHAAVKHSLKEYVRGDVHTNGIESLWAVLKRAHKGTFHKMSPKHLDRYVQEFAGRHNVREQDTIDQMRSLGSGMEHKRLTYQMLIRDNGLASGARAQA